MNVNLGAPYEAIMRKIVENGYAGNQTEVIRQALSAYEKQLEYEEVVLVNKAIEAEMRDIKSGKTKTFTHEQIKKKFGL